jgi:hypothetical protein
MIYREIEAKPENEPKIKNAIILCELNKMEYSRDYPKKQLVIGFKSERALKAFNKKLVSLNG